MADQVWKVRLGGQILYFMDDDKNVADAPLCTEVGDRVDVVESYAHVYRGGPVLRYHEVIGQHADLEFLELVDEPPWE